jgi:hypothetical protein
MSCNEPNKFTFIYSDKSRALSGRACCGECSPRRYHVIRSVQKVLSPHCWARIAAIAETSAPSVGLNVTGIVSLPPSRISAHCCRVGPSSDVRSAVMLSVAKQTQIEVRRNSLRAISYQIGTYDDYRLLDLERGFLRGWKGFDRVSLLVREDQQEQK